MKKMWHEIDMKIRLFCYCIWHTEYFQCRLRWSISFTWTKFRKDELCLLILQYMQRTLFLLCFEQIRVCFVYYNNRPNYSIIILFILVLVYFYCLSIPPLQRISRNLHPLEEILTTVKAYLRICSIKGTWFICNIF